MYLGQKGFLFVQWPNLGQMVATVYKRDKVTIPTNIFT